MMPGSTDLPESLSVRSNSTDSLDDQSTSSGSTTEHGRQLSLDGSEFIPTRTNKTVGAKPPKNSLQFVKTGPCDLYKSAHQQMLKAEEVRVLRKHVKEEEEDWQMNLDSWKSSRRKKQEDVMERVAEVKKIELAENVKTRKKSKTFSEMMEERGARGRRCNIPTYNDDNDLSDLGIGSSIKSDGPSRTGSDAGSDHVFPDEDSDSSSGMGEKKIGSNKVNGHSSKSQNMNGHKVEEEEYTYERAIQNYIQYAESHTKVHHSTSSKVSISDSDHESKNVASSDDEVRPGRSGSRIEEKLQFFNKEMERESSSGLKSNIKQKLVESVTDSGTSSDDGARTVQENVSSSSEKVIPDRDPGFREKLENFKNNRQLSSEEDIPEVHAPPIRDLKFKDKLASFESPEIFEKPVTKSFVLEKDLNFKEKVSNFEEPVVSERTLVVSDVSVEDVAKDTEIAQHIPLLHSPSTPVVEVDVTHPAAIEEECVQEHVTSNVNVNTVPQEIELPTLTPWRETRQPSSDTNNIEERPGEATLLEQQILAELENMDPHTDTVLPAMEMNSTSLTDFAFPFGPTPHAEPPREKPPPPPVESDSGESDSGVDEVAASQEQSLQQDTSTKRIRKEIWKRRSDFLGIEKSEEEGYVDSAAQLTPPPDLQEILKEERKFDELMRNEEEAKKRETNKRSSWSLKDLLRGDTSVEEEISRKEQEIIENLEREEQEKFTRGSVSSQDDEAVQHWRELEWIEKAEERKARHESEHQPVPFRCVEITSPTTPTYTSSITSPLYENHKEQKIHQEQDNYDEEQDPFTTHKPLSQQYSFDQPPVPPLPSHPPLRKAYSTPFPNMLAPERPPEPELVLPPRSARVPPPPPPPGKPPRRVTSPEIQKEREEIVRMSKHPGSDMSPTMSPTEIVPQYSSSGQQMSRQTLHKLSATPKSRLKDGESWMAKKKPESQRKEYKQHWLFQEAEQRRITEMQDRDARKAKTMSGSPTTPDNSQQDYVNINSLSGMYKGSSPTTPVSQEHSPTTENRMLSVSGKKKCSHCGEELGRGAAMIIESLRLFYHISCFKCCVCHAQLGNGSMGADVRVRNNKLHCHNCYSNDEGLKFSKV